MPLLIFIGLVALLGWGLTQDPEKVPSPLIGKPVPQFSLPTVSSPTGAVTPERLEGQVYLLNVWASWCVACRQEHPVLMEASRNHPNLAIIGFDYKDKRADARRWLRERGDPYDLSLFDPAGEVGIDLGVYGVPETFVVDSKGIIRHKHIGPLTRKELRNTIMPLVRELRAES
ncbi:DsbE family thiol:disulfide interchange protein [Thiohalorhabdus methylotrophus]|uniref:DsbE family thiol:disulfide interchange protein n=1 Tax=Thiohalorhabdus methylotrophus TaxID=3242694 RepID=A0ABV4TS07_9GAMM